MNAKHKPLTPEDFGLDKKQLTELVTGAQTFLSPVPDEADSEPSIPKVDSGESAPIS